MKRKSLLVLCCLAGLSGLADVVHVFEQSEVVDETVQIADRMLDTGRNYKTGVVPAMSGWIFTHWTISTAQDFAERDAWGRAIDSTGVLTDGQPLEIVAVTAQNKEQRMKLYWYGTTDVSMDSDTDGDDLTFAEELANGTNPLMADADIEGPFKTLFTSAERLSRLSWLI